MTGLLHNTNILLGITGGIAAYKCCELIRRLRDEGANVQVVLTAGAEAFVTPLTLQALSGQPVRTDLLDPQAEAAMGHIELARWADLILVAPASADFMARLAAGMANDLLSTVCLATAAPIALAPAMNRLMWANQATQANANGLQQRGIQLWGPAEGSQACGETGEGRMLEPAQLLQACTKAMGSPVTADQGALAGQRVLITAGPTAEPLDPVRYLSNHSSGKMGFALAQAASKAGAMVTLIAGPTRIEPPNDIANVVPIQTALQMHAAAMEAAPNIDIFIAAAAVADYRVAEQQPQKIKKSAAELVLKLVKNPDVLADVSSRFPQVFTCGFAAETNEVIAYARGKLEKKKLNMIAANEVGNGLAFNQDDNALHVLWADGQQSLPQASKTILAEQLIALIAERYITT